VRSQFDVTARTVRAGTRSPVDDSPPTDELVQVPAGDYCLGEPGEERTVSVGPVLVGRFPVTNARLARFVRDTGSACDAGLAARLEVPMLADHPATGLTFAQALAFCRWASGLCGRTVRLPTGDEWEAAARGPSGRTWPWGDSFDVDRCACAESGWGATVPVGAHPAGASEAGAEQLAGNVWEWVDADAGDGWVFVRGGSYLDHAWGVRASRALPADPLRATATTGFRIAVDDERRSR
jgi:formylglycine-generating enzyme required for sulfatase activity